MKILAVLPRIPYPLNDGGAIATYNTIKHLHLAGHEVRVLAVNTKQHRQAPEVLHPICSGIRAVHHDTDVRLHKVLLNYYSKVPYKFKRYYNTELAAILAEEVRHENYDVIMLDQTPTVVYQEIIRRHCRTPMLLRNHNVEHIIYERMAEKSNSSLKRIYMRRMARDLRAFEAHTYAKMNGIAVMTEADSHRVRALGYNGPLAAIPVGYDSDTFRPNPSIHTKANTVFFFGAFDWMPNADAVDWFMREVFDDFRRLYPDTELHLGGKRPSQAIRNLAELPGVFVHADVPSARDFLQEYDILIVPLLSGGGMRVKIVEAMAMGKAIIASSIGAEGIVTEAGCNILFADSKQEFLDSIGLLLKDSERKRSLGEAARRTATEHYNWKTLTAQLADFMAQCSADAR